MEHSEPELVSDFEPNPPGQLPTFEKMSIEHDLSNPKTPVPSRQYTPYRQPELSLENEAPQVSVDDRISQHSDKHTAAGFSRYFWQESQHKGAPRPSDIGLVNNPPKNSKPGSTVLVSVVSESHHSLKPRPELWETIEEQAQLNIPDCMGDWPARLLQVSTWTSLEWQPGNIYGSQKEPPYAIISYTWGRWALPTHDRPTLNVSGITWEIPPINPVLFTVAEFENILRTACTKAETDFVWIDVACIDQTEGSRQKDKEIGRQAKIFRGATKAFIWMVDERNKDEASHDILRKLESVSVAAHTASHPDTPDHNCSASEKSSLGPSAEGVSDNQANRKWIGDAALHVSNLIGIPWFSSIWTLQEAFLRQEAEFLDRQGRYSFSVTGDVFTLDDVLTHCNHLYQLCSPAANPLTRSPEDNVGSVLVLKAGLISMLERTGLHALADRDRTTLYACATARQAHDPNDRIYGIMQVWNFQLGKAAPGASLNRKWTTDELALEFGKKLLDEFPVESQLHVHKSAPPGRQSWRVSNTSAVPRYPIWVADSGHLEGIIDRRGSTLHCRLVNGIVYGHFTGKSCSFAALCQAWSLIPYRDDDPSETTSRANQAQIALDGTEILHDTLFQKRYSLRDVPDDKQQELAASICAFSERVSRRISVLLLGIVKQQQGEILRTIAIGLIVMEAPDEAIGGWQKRLGFCLWDVPCNDDPRSNTDGVVVDILSADSSVWELGECIFG